LISLFEYSRFTFFYPEQLVQELRNAPSKPRLAARLTPEQVDNLVDLLELKGHLVAPEQIPPVSRDSNDDIFLACAASAHADYLVTGDNDLLVIAEFRGTKIITPSQFLQILETS
jgi:putative PIN family toxin of toxin-antitoxin system